MFHAVLLVFVIPEESVTTTGNCAPATDPGATIDGLANMTIASSVPGPLGPACTVQVALLPQMMSATVLVLPPVHIAGPALVAGPQSLSVSLMRACTSTVIAWLKSMMTVSPESRVFAKPPDDVSTADVESGPAAPLVLMSGFRRGDNAVLPEGKRFVVYVQRDTIVKIQSPLTGAQPGAP